MPKKPGHAAALAPSASPAPKDGDAEAKLEASLLSQSRGLYNPGEMRRRRRARPPQDPEALGAEPWTKTRGIKDPRHPGIMECADGRRVPRGRVSVVTPTTDARHAYHERAYRCFDAQKWQDKEMVVIETYRERPSPFFGAVDDSRIVYVAIRVPPGQPDLTIGLKRNIGLHLATGDWIASFDDDDVYAPNYVPEMLEEMATQRGFAITLGSWYIFDAEFDTYGYVDPRRMGAPKKSNYKAWRDEEREDLKEWLYGYGFSYVFSRRHAVEHPFPDVNMGEDYAFFDFLRWRIQVVLLFDEYGICLHTLHDGSTSKVVACRAVRRDEVPDLDVAALLDHTDIESIPWASMKREQSPYILSGEKPAKKVVKVRSSLGEVEMPRRPGCTALDVKRHMAFTYELRPEDVIIRRTSDDEGPALEDQERLGLRTKEVWAVLPIDSSKPQAVSVRCIDSRDHTIAVDVSVSSTTCLMTELRAELLRLHGGTATKDVVAGTRLARWLEKRGMYQGFDAKAIIGSTRQVYVLGLAVLLGRYEAEPAAEE